jgi:DeoR/GlpR family transcriptional regulator of sugar metabolism
MNGINARQKEIMDRLNAKGEVRIAELKDRFQVTEMTIRRDLERLEMLGLVKRTFGGAILAGKDIALGERAAMRMEEKARIGKLAASLIRPGESIFIDSGTTTLQLARHLPAGLEITAVTNALNVASELMERNIPAIVTGGILIGTTSSMAGPVASSTLAGMAFDRVFMGATGLDAEHGFSNSNIHEAEIKSIAIRQAREVNMLIDSSKFGARALVSFAPLDKAHRIICERAPEGPLFLACKEAGVDILVAE